MELGRAGDGDDIRALGEQPGERDLRGGGALLGGDLLQQGDEVLVAGQGVRLEAGQLGPHVVRRQRLPGLQRAGEEAAT